MSVKFLTLLLIFLLLLLKIGGSYDVILSKKVIKAFIMVKI